MFNLRFKYVVATHGFYVCHIIPRANYMLKHKEKYSVGDRFEFAKKIMDHLRKRSRTETVVYGKENIPGDETCIFYSNHQGKYDALGILLQLEKPCGVLWEKKQSQRLLSKQVCRLIEGVPIDLTDIREMVRSIAKVTEDVRNGRNYLIFPEGGYEDDTHNSLQEFKQGCFSCSLKSGATIVPIAIYDSYKAMNSNTFEKVTTQVHFLKPIPYSEYAHMNKGQLADMVKDRIAGKLTTLTSITG